MNIIVFIRFYFIFSFFINLNLNLDETPRNLKRFLLSSLVGTSKFREIRPDFVGIVNPGLKDDGKNKGLKLCLSVAQIRKPITTCPFLFD